MCLQHLNELIHFLFEFLHFAFHYLHLGFAVVYDVPDPALVRRYTMSLMSLY